MKYKPEDYLGCGFYSNTDSGIEHHKEKIVTCRRPHMCMGGCDTEIKPGEQALYETCFMDGAPADSYTCLPCIEKWLEESGQVETEEHT